jgi:hypothetical protein
MIAVANELGERQADAATSLPQMVADALSAFAEDGPVAAARMAQEILKATEERVTRLEDCDLSERLGRQTAFLALRELDAALLSTDGLVNLLVLKRRSETDDEDGTRRTLGDLFQRLTNWLVIHEGEPLGPTADPHQFTLRIRRLQSFLHLVDADGTQVEARENLLRARRVLTTRVLLTRLRSDQGVGLRRALCAASARAMDALVREEVAEISDVVIFAGDFSESAEDIRSISEASMMPEVERALDAYQASGEGHADARPRRPCARGGGRHGQAGGRPPGGLLAARGGAARCAEPAVPGARHRPALRLAGRARGALVGHAAR